MIPPGGGFSPAGSSGGHGVGSFVAKRTRTAVSGLYRYAVLDACAAACCRSGVTSSRIQNPRPCVPAIRSEHMHVLSSFTIRSRTEIAGMSIRSDCQWSPSSKETHTCVSVDAYSSPGLRGSSRIEFETAPGAMPLSISVHVRPPSCVLKKCGFMSSSRIVFVAAYAVCVSKWPASMLKMRVHALIELGVTFFQTAPPLSVTWMLPSSVPAQITLMLLGDGDSAVMVPSGVGFTLEA